MNRIRKILAVLTVIILFIGMYFSNILQNDNKIIKENENQMLTTNNNNNITINCEFPNETQYMKIYSLKPFNFSLENCNDTLDKFFPNFRNNSEINTTNVHRGIVYHKNNTHITICKSGGIAYYVDPLYSKGNNTINISQAKKISYNFVSQHGNFSDDIYLNSTINMSNYGIDGFTFIYMRNISNYPIVGNGVKGIMVFIDSLTGNVTSYTRLLREIGEPVEYKKIITAKLAFLYLNNHLRDYTANITSIKLGYFVKNIYWEQLKMYPVWIFYAEDNEFKEYETFSHCVNAITGVVY